MNTTKYELTAAARTIFGKKTKNLRKAGQLPANISGKVDQPVAITLDAKTFSKIFAEAGETGVVYVQVEGEKQARPTLIDQVDYQTMSNQPIHVSLRQVDLKEKVSAEVPVELIGELGLKEATAQLLYNELEVEALPTDFPEAFEIDLTQFTEIGQEFTLAQLNIDTSKLTIELPPETVLLQIQKVEQMAEEPVEAAPTTPEAVETTVQGAATEGGEAGEKVEDKNAEA